MVDLITSEGTEVAVVPDFWFQIDSCCYPSKRTAGERPIVMREQPQDDWYHYPAIVVGTYGKSFYTSVQIFCISFYSTGSYHDARKKLSLAEITNEIPPSDPEGKNLGRGKRQKKPRVPYSPDDETSDEEPIQPPKRPSASSVINPNIPKGLLASGQIHQNIGKQWSQVRGANSLPSNTNSGSSGSSAGHTSQCPEGYVGQTCGSSQPEETFDSAMYVDQITSQSNIGTDELASQYSSSYSAPSWFRPSIGFQQPISASLSPVHRTPATRPLPYSAVTESHGSQFGPPVGLQQSVAVIPSSAEQPTPATRPLPYSVTESHGSQFEPSIGFQQHAAVISAVQQNPFVCPLPYSGASAIASSNPISEFGSSSGFQHQTKTITFSSKSNQSPLNSQTQKKGYIFHLN